MHTLGASKGGFAALYIGVKYDYTNIVAPSFVSSIGERMAYFRTEIADHVMGEYDESTIELYNNLLRDAIISDKNRNKNIYVFLSVHDSFYKGFGQLEMISELATYSNFNMFLTESKLAYQHDQVATYYLQEILSVLSLLTQGIATRLERQVFNGKSIGLLETPKKDEVGFFNKKKEFKQKQVNSITKLFMDGGLIFIEGLAFIHNYNSPSYKFLSKSMCLYNTSSTDKWEYTLGTSRQKPQTRSMFSGAFVDYTAAGVATMGYKGIDLAKLPEGVYKILLSITKTEKIRDYKDINFVGELDEKYLLNNIEYRLFKKGKVVYLVKRPVFGRFLDKSLYFFDFHEKPYIEDRRFYLKGDFIVPGIDIYDFNIGNYYLVLKNKKTAEIKSVALGQMKNAKHSLKIDSILGGYDACSFASMGFKGVDIGEFDFGEYDLYVSLSYKSEIFSHKLPFDLVIKRKGLIFKSDQFFLKEV